MLNSNETTDRIVRVTNTPCYPLNETKYTTYEEEKSEAPALAEVGARATGSASTNLK